MGDEDLRLGAPFRHHPPDFLGDAAFMLGIDEGEDEADTDRLAPDVEQGLGGGGCLGQHQRQYLTAGAVYASADAVNPRPRHQGFVVDMGHQVQAIGDRIAEVGLDAPFKLQIVLHAGGDDESDAAPLAFEQAVQHRGAGIDAGTDARHRGPDVEVPIGEGIA